MDILYLLIPLSVLLVLLIVGVFGWAINNGQLEDLEREGNRILEDGDGFDEHQVPPPGDGKESPSSN
ncbi:cbb3-type cytochrome oxidase assembly protein CcoS [Paucibacter sp. B2R-40]|uniref:cbb3-type cytochrome oxidase assembly protein CcoS n=1 Tax=Paucibacter sp. B2R-40 TaxID=2893554 RepID=UPI0021E4982C|nr:cbb3-type cytochrome oxidase assembly protein CcoS [Paucibacter sp. B2R-40]MCV2354150.1 cbb3-type cytochrome oxidase assembly protein CcoS [Paucibacter sp. B2R-40]